MPVLFNKESGAIENVAADQADALLQAGTYEIPLNDPEGNPVAASPTDAPNLLGQGYSQPAPEQLKSLLEQTKYTTGAEQAATAVESTLSALTFGASTAGLQALGVRPYDMRKRQEYNPGIAMTGEIAGLGVGVLAGVGAPAVLERVGVRTGEAVAKALGEGAISKIGSLATRGAVENALFQSGNEVSKMFYSDPAQTIETAATDIGLSGLIGAGFGGGIGATSELWKATAGKSVNSVLQALKNRSSGLPVELKTAANLDLTPEIEAALGDSPLAKQAAQQLFESETKAGIKYQQAFQNFKNQASDALGQAFGKTADDVADLAHLSNYETGRTFQKTLGDEIASKIEPISLKYDGFAEKFKGAVLSEADKSDIAGQIANKISDLGLDKGPNESALKLANRALEQLPKQQTAQDLRKYAQGLMQAAPYGTEQYQVGKVLRNVFNDAQEKVIGREAGAAGLFDDFQRTQAEYGKFKNLLEELNDRLHLGRESKGGAKSFTTALKSMDPETIVKRLGLKDDVNLQALLAQQFPETANLARQQEINDLLKKSLDNKGTLDPNKLSKNIKALSPELKGYLVSPDAAGRIDAIQQLLTRVPQRLNPSGTARTLDMLWNKVPASGAAMVAMMTGNNPIMGAIIGQLAHSLGREVPDGVKLAMLKYMGSTNEVSASGLKAAAKLAQKTINAEKKLDVSAKAIFGGKAADIREPSAADLEKLKKKIDEVVEDPSKLMADTDNTGYYMPDHGSAISLTAARNVQYLASLRPNTTPVTPFSGKQVATAEQETEYNNALKIAESPLIIMNKIKDGTLTQKDITHLAHLYPQLAGRMMDKINKEMIESSTEGQVTVPYHTQLALAAFMGMPLSPSMSSAAIMSAQPAMQPPAAPQGRGPSSYGSGSRLNKLDKLPGAAATPQQLRQMNKNGLRH